MDDSLAGLPPDRAAAVAAWLLTPLWTCRVCGAPVLPTDPRVRDPDASRDEEDLPVLHLDCGADQLRLREPRRELRQRRHCESRLRDGS